MKQQKPLVIKNDEQNIFALRALYHSYGYKQFKMSKFEEYDLYAENKNFLISNNIITFSENGRLMALKPDVTLSIVKNTKDESGYIEKVYYNENVYRMDSSSHEFTEIVQTGLECIGELDLYNISEVVLLAAKSLKLINENFLLEISHMSFVTSLLESAGLNENQQQTVLLYMNKKDTDGILQTCKKSGVKDELCTVITALCSVYGPFKKTLPILEKLSINDKTANALTELKAIYEILKSAGFEKNINLDFSITSDTKYYNGLIFQGFVDGIPKAVLSGGRYDKLVHKFGRNSGAIGFAVYISLLEFLDKTDNPFDVDILLLYDDKTNFVALTKLIKALTDNGSVVKAQKSKDSNIKYKQLAKINSNGGLEIIETVG